jgi:hypothetical protein
VSAGPWRAHAVAFGLIEQCRDAGSGLTLTAVQYADRSWAWEAVKGDHTLAVGCNEPTLPAAMEAADLWASENGYPAVRVDVDP